MADQTTISFIIHPKPKKRIRVFVSVQTGRMCLKGEDGTMHIMWFDG